MRTLFFTLGMLSIFPPVFAQDPDAGRREYETRCARCHGGNAGGGESGPAITAQIAASNDADLAAFLRQGRPASGMPAFDLTAAPMNGLIRYLRTLGDPIPRNTPPVAVRRKIQTADGQTLEGQALSEGISDLQLRTDDKRIRLLRKEGERYRIVTSQTDWPTYHGDPSGNRYSQISQINRSNVARLAPRWVFPMPNVTTIENTPVVVEGIMYVSSANELYALDAGSGRAIWHYQRARTKGIAGNAALGFNRGVAWAGDRVFMLTDNAHMLPSTDSTESCSGKAKWRTGISTTTALLLPWWSITS